MQAAESGTSLRTHYAQSLFMNFYDLTFYFFKILMELRDSRVAGQALTQPPGSLFWTDLSWWCLLGWLFNSLPNKREN